MLQNSENKKEKIKVVGKIYNIPATSYFIKTIASDFIKNGSINDLFLLPTKRATRSLQEEIYNLSKEQNIKTIELPKIMAFGEVNEDDLFFEESTIIPIEQIEKSSKEFLSSIERTAILSEFIMAKFQAEIAEKNKANDKKKEYFSWDKAIALAAELGKLIDSFEIEEIDLNSLDNLYPEEYSEHYKNVIKLLEVIKEYWNKILDAENKINPAKQQVLSIKEFSTFLKSTNKFSRIIIAGTTASQPATRELISNVLQKENGLLILPSLDKNITEETWHNIGQSHSQYGMKYLLEILNVKRKSIQDFPENIENKSISSLEDFEIFLSEIMKDLGIETSYKNKQISKDILSHIDFIKASNNREESELISIAIAEELQKNPNKQITIVSPDRKLTRAVGNTLNSFGIKSDDSGGLPLTKTPLGKYILLLSEIVLSDYDAFSIVSLLENKYSNFIENFIIKNLEINTTEIKESDLKSLIKNKKDNLIKNSLDLIFRGEQISEGLEGILSKLHSQKILKIESQENKSAKYQPHLRNISTNDIDEIISLFKEVSNIFRPFESIFTSNENPSFSEVIKGHIKVIESATDFNKIFTGSNEGKTLQKSLIEINNIMSENNITTSLFEYEKILTAFLDTRNIRNPQFNHQVQMLGPIEARMLSADMLILAGLNEGVFPQGQADDIFLNTKLRDDLGLPLPERRIGLSSHDFASLISSSKEVLLFHSSKRDGAAALPSRWLQKIDSYLARQDIKKSTKKQQDLKSKRTKIFTSKESNLLKRISYNPSAEIRPQKLSATFIEKALKDPYQIYARYILQLYKKDEINLEITSAGLGTIMHEALENFINKNLSTRYDLEQEFQRLLNLKSVDDSIKIFWEGRFKKFAKWFVPKYIEEKTTDLKHTFTEIKGAYTIPSATAGKPFSIEGTADRIDHLQDGTFNIIDYKTGSCPSWSDVLKGKKPQMAIESLILEKGIFKSQETGRELQTLQAGKVSKLTFITMQSNQVSIGSEKIFPDKKLSEEEQSELMQLLIAKTEQGIKTLNKEFLQKSRPLIAAPTPESQEDSFFNDYKHLERIKEWKNNV